MSSMTAASDAEKDHPLAFFSEGPQKPCGIAKRGRQAIDPPGDQSEGREKFAE